MLSIPESYMIYIVIYHFLPKRMKIDKSKKLVYKKKYVVDIRSLKQALNYGLKLKKVHRIMEFNQE